MKYALLIPPSKGQEPGGTGPPWTAGDQDLDADRDRVCGAVERSTHRLSAAKLSKLFDAKGDTFEAARLMNQQVRSAPTIPAIERYSGVLYDSLDYRTMSPAGRRRIDRSTLIFTALLGVVRARDPLPQYRLGFDASLGSLGRLATWWRPRITASLAATLTNATVWDLLPGEHAAAWTPAEIDMRRRYVVRFLDANGRTVSHWNKVLKGALARHLAENGLSDPGVLATFDHPTGYRWDRRATTEVGNVTTLVVRATDRTS